MYILRKQKYFNVISVEIHIYNDGFLKIFLLIHLNYINFM